MVHSGIVASAEVSRHTVEKHGRMQFLGSPHQLCVLVGWIFGKYSTLSEMSPEKSPSERIYLMRCLLEMGVLFYNWVTISSKVWEHAYGWMYMFTDRRVSHEYACVCAQVCACVPCVHVWVHEWNFIYLLDWDRDAILFMKNFLNCAAAFWCCRKYISWLIDLFEIKRARCCGSRDLGSDQWINRQISVELGKTLVCTL